MSNNSPRQNSSKPGLRWPLIIGFTVLLALAIALLMRRQPERSPTPTEVADAAARQTAALGEEADADPTAQGAVGARRSYAVDAAIEQPAKQVVTAKVTRFARTRKDIVGAMAAHFKVTLPPEVDQFFDAVQAGDWDKVQEAWTLLEERRGSGEHSEAMHKVWHALGETHGAAKAAQTWDPQHLLDYGNAILDSLAPGMVYIGGTDAGRFIPTLMNETSNDAKHVVLTQSAFADFSYLEYAAFLYGDRVSPPDANDSQRAFQEYIADAQQRLQHDQQFPNEPKQLRPGEDIQVIDNRVQVSGQTAVMAINERLLQAMVEKNPGVRFALEESFPFDSTYANAAPLGPVMELRAQEGADAVTPERINAALDYWGARSQEFAFSDPNEAPEARAAWATMAAAQGNLFLAHNYAGEAEQAFRLAQQMSPATQQAVLPFVNLLAEQSRYAEAIPVLERAVELAPENVRFQNLLSELQTKRQLQR